MPSFGTTTGLSSTTPKAAVYSAFYSEEEITSGDASTTLPTYLNRMRVRQTRLHNGAKIGYYGGARVISGTTDTLKPDISIDNREKLTATFYCNNPLCR